MARCRFCGEKAEIFLRYARMPLCKKCFPKYYTRKVSKALEKMKIASNDKILVALSGGKDSAALLHSLSSLRKVSAIHIMLGVENYSKKMLEACESLCKDLDVKLIVYDIKKELGFSASDFVKFSKSACSVCGTIKRYLLNKIAWENSFDYVATGHNADDLSSHILSNFIDGNISLLARIEFFSAKNEKLKLVGRIKPLYRTLEFENELYCKILSLPYVSDSCPLGKGAPQKEIKKLLNLLEKRVPEIKLRIITNYFKFKPLLEKYAEKEKVLNCTRCGFPTDRKICKFCKIVEKLNSLND